MAKNSSNKIILTVIVSIILTILIISLINIGLSIFLVQPDYSKYCEKPRQIPIPEDLDLVGGTCATVSPDSRQECCINKGYENYNEKTGVCTGTNNDFIKCQENYEKARDNFNQIRFYFLALIGFILLIIGLYTKGFYQFTGLASGTILLAQGIATNLQSKILVFVSLLVIIIIFGFLARKIINKI